MTKGSWTSSTLLVLLHAPSLPVRTYVLIMTLLPLINSTNSEIETLRLEVTVRESSSQRRPTVEHPANHFLHRPPPILSLRLGGLALLHRNLLLPIGKSQIWEVRAASRQLGLVTKNRSKQLRSMSPATVKQICLVQTSANPNRSDTRLSRPTQS